MIAELTHTFKPQCLKAGMKVGNEHLKFFSLKCTTTTKEVYNYHSCSTSCSLAEVTATSGHIHLAIEPGANLAFRQ